VLVRGGKAALGHVGDSRAYLMREGHLHQISDDHTFAAEAVRKGVLSPEEVAEIPEAAYLTRAVGPHPSVLVDTLVFDILPGDTILLCSDGLHGYFENDEEVKAMMQEPAEQIAGTLIAFANERGGEDNITAVVLRASTDVVGGVDEKRATRVNANISALRHIDLFCELTMPELAHVTEVLRSADYDEGATILCQGDSSESLFVIVEGAASVERDGEAIATLGAGSHFGEMALLTHRPRIATVKAVKPCRLLVLEREAFYSVAQQDPVIGVKFLWKLAQTLSTRLDDSFVPTPRGDVGRPTVRYGMFPSPFSQR
jgi:CRP-like cAMP-binding protein